MILHKFNKNKELKKLKFNNSKSNYLKLGTFIASVMIIIISVIYFTYSKFTLTDTFTTTEITVGDFIPADYILYYYVDGVAVNTIPETGNYDVNVSCDNGATGTWNNQNKSISISNATNSKTRCTLSFITNNGFKDDTGASRPELYDGLIPVTYDSNNNNEIIVADITSEWYNYDNHEWANAILIDQSNSTIKDKYLNADGTYKSGTTVSISDVLQMYVWVPRYKYQLFNVEGAQTTAQMINVEFENNSTSKSSGTQNGEWLTHPAFTFGDTELNGIWVGKFESSGTTDNITIIPNVSSLREINLGTMFNTTRSIETTTKYGLTSSEVDTHVMKNMEWGAVAYLTSSKYGIYIDASTCINSECEVWINNNSNYTTGCAGDSVSAAESTLCNAWNTATGVNASTTGNIYGIYDMSGGAWEYVMGNYNKTVGSSGINFSSIDSKYYDVYTGSSVSAGKLGDATKETQGWNRDYAYFVDSSSPWFGRGGEYNYGSLAGVFGFVYSNGNAYSSRSWRVVLSAE